ncbi:ABC transporter permease [Fodinicurvata sediminis]|uniref:ABC transporter permease n=1 Tax=Fodinicurvata sediminis TaxID=1121832 RepID=UPI0003B6E9A0|nr:ABC transporter permease [Fodinicurvata sediminis]
MSGVKQIGARLRPLGIFIGILVLWQALVWVTGAPAYILPAPSQVGAVLFKRWDSLAFHAGITLAEILLGFFIGSLFGIISALMIATFRTLRFWLLPVLVVSQAIPVFALAPVLVLWLGYGMASKIAMASLIIFFPVTTSFHDGLRRTETGWLDLARTCGASKWATFRHVRILAALPALASGLRVAAAVAPIGAIIGEWVGSSAGLGHLMLNANARMQIDVMFAALVVLAVLALLLYFLTDRFCHLLLPWSPEESDIAR